MNTFTGSRFRRRRAKRVSTTWKRAIRGQIAVLILLALPVLLLSMSLCIDVGDLYLNRVRIQTAIDSSVLAGANWLPDYHNQAISTAQAYAIQNGVKAGEIQNIAVAADNKSLTMTVARTVPCFFCIAMGEGVAYASTGSGGTGITALATAGIVPVSAAYGITPVGVDYRTNLNFGSQVILKQGQVGAGNWDPLALGGQGADQYRSNLQSGYQGKVSAGDWINTETGNVVGPTNQGISARISNGQSMYPSSTFANHTLDDPRIIVVPVVDFSNINGQSQVPVKGFAVMWVAGVDQQGAINCYFMHQSIPNATTDPNASAFGASNPVLLQ